MKKETEKQPIDDLFARKLSNMSLLPSSDGFERLQKRMNQNKPDERRVLFWHNPSIQRYMAVAACLILISLFGWLYRQPSAQTTLGKPPVAANYRLPEQPRKIIESPTDAVAATGQKEVGQLVLIEEEAVSKRKNLSKAQADNIRKPSLPAQALIAMHSESFPAQVEPTKTKIDSEEVHGRNKLQTEHSAEEQLADKPTKTKTSPSAERVLIVTIEEPASLVAARQTAQKFVEEKAVLPANDKEMRGGIWNQVRRFKEGELFARHSDGTRDEQGLLDRAYTTLKHSIDKNKQAKQ